MSRKVRLLATLAVITLIVTQLASAGHHILVAHYVCATHGTLHHGSAEAASSSDSPIDSVSVPVSLEHAHDDCTYFSRLPDATLGTTATAVDVSETGTQTTLSLREADAFITLAQLTLAPKQSPPIAV